MLLLVILLITALVFAQQVEKPFVQEHLFHEHTVDFVNTTVFQQYKSYGALYNTSHVFFYLDLNGEDKLFLNASITFGDGIIGKAEREGFTLTPTGDDLESYLKDINGTGRKYLLELAYEKSFRNITFSAGLLDSTSYIDTSEYANDEHTQFLNTALINNPVVSLPSYNPGAYLHYELSPNLALSLLYIDNEPDPGNAGILQIEISTANFNLRPYYSYVFGGDSKGFGISGDLTLSESLGIFFRFGSGSSQDFLSGGFELKNLLFKDKLGIGYAYLKEKISRSVAELYYSLKIIKYLTVSFDIQYLKEEKEAFIYGVRLFFER